MKERLAGVGREGEGGGGGVYSSEFVVGVCPPFLQILTLFHTKTLVFSTPFFRPGIGRNEVIIFRVKLISSIKKTS